MTLDLLNDEGFFVCLFLFKGTPLKSFFQLVKEYIVEGDLQGDLYYTMNKNMLFQ